MPKKLILDLMRHGECEPQDPPIWLRGSGTDSPLSSQGWQQMLAQWQVQQAVGLPPYDAIVTSPLQRCQVFALQQAEQYQLPLKVIPQWQERDFGAWDGLSFEAVKAQYPVELTRYLDNPFSTPIPEAETVTRFNRRFHQVWTQTLNWAKQEKLHHLLVLTHGGTMRRALQTVLAIPNRHWYQLKIKHSSLIRFDIFWYDSDMPPFIQLSALIPPVKHANATQLH